jgi:hypothetical protein
MNMGTHKLPFKTDTTARLVHSWYVVYGIGNEDHGNSSGSKAHISNVNEKDCSNYFKSICGEYKSACPRLLLRILPNYI